MINNLKICHLLTVTEFSRMMNMYYLTCFIYTIFALLIPETHIISRCFRCWQAISRCMCLKAIYFDFCLSTFFIQTDSKMHRFSLCVRLWCNYMWSLGIIHRTCLSQVHKIRTNAKTGTRKYNSIIFPQSYRTGVMFIRIKITTKLLIIFLLQ